MISQSSSERLDWLDGWRGISVLFVLTSHVSAHFFAKGPASEILEPLGYIGVLVFFAISGFIITLLAKSEVNQNGNFNIGKFYGRRILRIVPPLLVYVIFIVLTGLADTSQSLRAISFTCNIAVDDIPSCGWIFGHFWSLAFEEQFYLIFPFLFLRRFSILLLPALAFAALPFAMPVQFIGKTGFIQIILVMCLGCIAALNEERLGKALSSISKVAGVLLVCSAGLVYFWAISDVGFMRKVMAPATSFLIIFIVIGGPMLYPSLRSILASLPLRTLGLYSYSVYLWQQYFTRQEAGEGLADATIAVVLTLFAAIISFYTIEAYFKRLSKQFFSTRSV